MGWWCWLRIKGNDSNLLPCTSIRYQDSKVWTTTYEQGHGCSPRSSWICT
ncbi:hypothetical protein OIU76_016458 [Salix suchowensis]|uniref:Uncharacterized protein n=1 Tax=Salix suchowensis TaxID=1278906 RepID=A0ABQ9ATY2_9ROSI|nr:hypothetical protein OIU77_004300 [Salix suchowensis]KAJ6379808.1 hypothetical protein OIU76_016458 [Salix suchowensis]